MCIQPIQPIQEDGDDVHVYIAYMGGNKFDQPHINSEIYYQILTSVLGSHKAAAMALIYSYNSSFSGFAAKLNAAQANTISTMQGVVSIFKSRVLKLHTTHSWDFMGLPLDGLTRMPIQETHHSEEGLVIGIIDSGIWPESESFKDNTLPPPPSSWKGVCQEGEKFSKSTCNRKLVGARWYVQGYEAAKGPLNTTEVPEYRSARDHNGHGTHTASTAGGSQVINASFMGLGRGIARGGASRARIAMYKVCWLGGDCSEADILAAYHDAISDGVDVISVSLGSGTPLPDYFASSLDIGSFHAMEKGIPVVFSAGNDGPDPASVSNTAPWSMSVAASTMDRSFPTYLKLGNNMSIKGEGVNTQQPNSSFIPLVDGASASREGTCGSLKRNLVSRKIVLCFGTHGSDDSFNAAFDVYLAGGAALIFSEVPTKVVPQLSFIPVVYVDMEQGAKILSYYKSSKSPVVRMSPSRSVAGLEPAPVVVYFSSRGPSTLSPDILKPDITAPGVNILAAWPPVIPPSEIGLDKRSVDYNFLSGTSMSCPHVSGIVALLKSIHPEWSPAAIRSAIMTTVLLFAAYVRDTSFDLIKAGGSGKPSDPFDFGAGHVNPRQAMNPGLVYDADPTDYIMFLCSLGYTQKQIRTIVSSSKLNTTCPEKSSASGLNYPSITVSNLESTTTIKRTVTNVSPDDNCLYIAIVSCPPGVEVIVKPNILVFTPNVRSASFAVTLKPVKHSDGVYNFGTLIWASPDHRVQSPIIVRVNNLNDKFREAKQSTRSEQQTSYLESKDYGGTSAV
ncbi:subtilisin-like protease SBT3.18 isoform X1 [Cryptomeria japonica]|uniref:subtilisin-like protease SBT3.18 isoform X1 n=1 Tax=Cryptomeria japonica TaxID=3369 RepID=UPI0025AC80F2|nr:subtilisin-like protease SBT3.18 isoform X1 [Cryptomeria japonica]